MKDIFSQKLIAETACGHDGSKIILKKLIDVAKYCGAETIKFQIFKVEERALPKTKEWSIFNKLELCVKDWEECINYSKKNKLNIISDVYGDKSFEIAQKNKVDGFKIHSEDFLNTFFIEKVIKKNKPVLISTGGTHRAELYDLIQWLYKRNKINNKIFLVPGIQTFPTPLEAHYVEELIDIKNKYSKFGVRLGYADHIAGDHIAAEIFPFMALAAGAEFVEKHFTDIRKFKRTDYHSALDKKRLKNFIIKLNYLTPTLKRQLGFNSFQKKYRKMFKKTVVINSSRKKNSIIKKDQIKFIKNTKNQSNLSSHFLVGKKLINNVEKGNLISLKNIKQKVGAIIVARLSSSRLPNKAILKINDTPSICLVIRRLKKIKRLDQIILATSKEKKDYQLIKIAKKENIQFFRGSLNNVVNRYYMAAKKFKLDQIVRITGDAILFDDLMMAKAISSQLKKNSDVTFIRNMPYGTAKEVINYKTIETINNTALKLKNTEYLEWFLENSKYFNVNYIRSDYIFDNSIRLTLDFKEDLLLFNKIFKYFKDKHSRFTLKEVLRLLSVKKNLVKINSFLTPKFKKNQINAELNI